MFGLGMRKDKGSDVDSFYAVRPESANDVPKTRFKIKVGKTLSPRRWRAAFTQEGYLDIAKILGRIHRGGIHPSIRGEVWEFLLGCFDPKSTHEVRDELRQRRRVQYARWKEECRHMAPIVGSGNIITSPIITEDGKPIHDRLVLLEANPDEGLTSTLRANGGSINSGLSTGNECAESASDHLTSNIGHGFKDVKDFTNHALLDKKVIQWKLTLHQIGLDVIRTDRTMVFYENQEHLSKLWDILAVYSWIDKDIGYCQGMSDLCSPMVVLLEDEADAFWCFERLMCRLRGNFRCTENSVGVESQLRSLASVTQILDPKLHQHFETLGGGNYLFAFRMLMVLFRREFSFGDSLYLWEMMWALEYDPDIFSMYEDQGLIREKREGSKRKVKSVRQCGKFERDNMKIGGKNTENLPISVFLVASVLKSKSLKLLQEARGLDDVVKILNDVTGNLDARKACKGAMKLHKKYLQKVKKAKIL